MERVVQRKRNADVNVNVNVDMVTRNGNKATHTPSRPSNHG